MFVYVDLFVCFLLVIYVSYARHIHASETVTLPSVYMRLMYGIVHVLFPFEAFFLVLVVGHEGGTSTRKCYRENAVRVQTVTSSFLHSFI